MPAKRFTVADFPRLSSLSSVIFTRAVRMSRRRVSKTWSLFFGSRLCSVPSASSFASSFFSAPLRWTGSLSPDLAAVWKLRTDSSSSAGRDGRAGGIDQRLVRGRRIRRMSNAKSSRCPVTIVVGRCLKFHPHQRGQGPTLYEFPCARRWSLSLHSALHQVPTTTGPSHDPSPYGAQG